jgi:exopolysaccharide production protein ExoQ
MGKRFERFTTMAMIVFLSGAILPMIFAEEYPIDVNTMSDSRLLVLQLLLYSLFLAVLGLAVFENKPFVVPPFWVGAFIFWVVLSVSWADEPFRAARKLVWDLLAMLFGIYLGHSYTNEEESDLIVKSLALCAFLSVLVAVADPSWAFMRGGALTGDLRGVFAHKNVLGKNMVLLSWGCVYRLNGKQIVRRGWALVVLAMAMGLLVFAKSATSLILFGLLFIILPVFRLLRLPRFQLVIGSLFAAIGSLGVAAVVIPNRSSIFALFGKNSDLTGRTELWSQVITAIGRHPWHGYGVYSFWLGTFGPSASVIEAVGWDVPHAHNGILDLLLDVGAIGLALFVLAYLSGVSGAIRNYRESRSDKDLWPLMVLIVFAGANLTESSIIHQSLFWTLFMSATFRASRRATVWPDSAPGKAEGMMPVHSIVPTRASQ